MTTQDYKIDDLTVDTKHEMQLQKCIDQVCVCVFMCQLKIERRNFNWIKSRNQHMDS